MSTLETADPPPRYSRVWFESIAFACWCGLISTKVLVEVFGWSRDGTLYWLVEGTLAVGFFGAGVPWLVLSARDLYRERRRVWLRARPLLFAAAALMVAFSGIALLAHAGR